MEFDDSAITVQKNTGKKRKPPIWPWILMLIGVLAGIYIYHQISSLMDEFGQTARDFTQLFEWLFSFVEER